jgi:hypothetical protein
MKLIRNCQLLRQGKMIIKYRHRSNNWRRNISRKYMAINSQSSIIPYKKRLILVRTKTGTPEITIK